MMEKYLNLNDVKEIRARSLIYFGCGAIQKVADVARDMKARGVDRVIVVSSPSAYKKSGAWPTITAAFEAAGVEYVLFDKNRPNPEVEAIDEALKVAVEGENIAMEKYPREEPTVAALEELEAEAWLALGETDRAVAMLERVYPIVEKATGIPHRYAERALIALKQVRGGGMIISGDAGRTRDSDAVQ